MIDDRYAGNRTRLHHKMLDIRFTIIPQLSIEAGLDHYAQWGGETEKDGKLPTSFKDYARVVLIKAGGGDAPENEINKLGNHIGNEFLKIRYNNERWGAEFYYDHIFEDGSGEKFRNRPDGLYGLPGKRISTGSKVSSTNFIIPNARVAPSTMIRSAERSSEVTIIISITEFISRGGHSTVK